MAVSEAEAARVRSAKQAEESRRAFADVLRESKPCISVQTQTQCSSDAEAAISIDPSGDDVAAAEAEAQFVSTAAGAKATAKVPTYMHLHGDCYNLAHGNFLATGRKSSCS